MTPLDLIYALADEIRRAVKDYRLAADEDGVKSISVIEGYAPKDYFDRVEYRDHPMIVVQLDGVDDHPIDDEGPLSTADVAIVVSLYGGEDVNAWIDLLNVMETIRQHLLIHRVIDQRYRLILPMNSDFPERQPLPFYLAEIDARYQIMQPQEPLSPSMMPPRIRRNSNRK